LGPNGKQGTVKTLLAVDWQSGASPQAGKLAARVKTDPGHAGGDLLHIGYIDAQPISNMLQLVAQF